MMITSTDRWERRIPLGIFFAALAVRLLFTLWMHDHYFFYHHPSADVLYYQTWARDIATGNILGTKVFFGLPLYPYVLAILDRIALGQTEIIRLFHLILGSLNCVMLYQLGKLLFSRTAGLLAAALMSVHFLMIYYDWLMMPVTLITALSLVILLALTQWEQFRSQRQWLILGTLIGAAILGDGKFLFFLLTCVVWFWFRHSRARRSVGVMMLAAVSIVGTCAVRNKIVSGDWVAISAQSGLSFYAGNHQGATGTYVNPGFIRPTHGGQDEDQRIAAEAIMNRRMSPAEVSRFWQSRGIRFIQESPGDYLRLVLRKARLFFQETEDAYDLDLLFLKDEKDRLDFNPLMILFPMAILGMGFSRSQWRSRPFIIFLILSQLLMTMVFFLTTRHRATIIPVLLLFQSITVIWLIHQCRTGRWVRCARVLLIIAIFAYTLPVIRMDKKVLTANRSAKAGAVYLKRGDLPEALRQYEIALTLNPEDSNTLYNLGNVYVAQNNLKQAARSYKEALQICPYNVDALFNLAYVAEQQGDPSHALLLYRQVEAYQPDTPDVLFRMAKLYADSGNCPQAIELYQRMIALEPNLEPKLRPYINHCPNQEISPNQ